MTKTELSAKTVAELKKVATEQGISGIAKKTKGELIELLSTSNTSSPENTKKINRSAIKLKKVVKEIDTPIIQKTSNVTDAEKVVEHKSPSPVPASSTEVMPSKSTAQSDSARPLPVDVSSSNRPIITRPIKQDISNMPSQQRKPQLSTGSQERQFDNRDNRNNNNQQKSRYPQQQNNQQRRNQSQQNQNDQQYQRNTDEMRDQYDPNSTPENSVEVAGILEVMSDGTHGVLRSQKLIPSDKDTYISISQVKKFRLRKGDYVTGIARTPKDNERYYSLLWIKDVNGYTTDQIQIRPNFEDLKPVYPDKQIKLEIGQFPVANRVVDILAPIGFGQRAMIVAQPKTGKTYFLKDIAKGINENHPDVQLIVVLIGERPEEVTDIERSVKGIVYASNFDDDPKHQVAVAELSLERAKRMVEMGKDVIILMDSLTRLARAYNVALPASGRTLSGGLDPVSLYPSKRFFGAARNFEVGASLTIIATALVDTGSKMDEVIFEEFKGTGNMEIRLDRKMSNKRVFPAINILESGTRNEELLLGTENLQNSWKIRRMLENLGQDANEALIDRMKSTKTNEEFLTSLHHY